MGGIGGAAAASAETGAAGLKRGEFRESVRVVAQIFVEIVGDDRKFTRLRVAAPVAAARFLAESKKLIGICDGERLECNRVDKSEYRGGGADGEGQSKDGCERERRRVAETAQGEAGVAQECFEKGKRALVAPGFAGGFNRAEFENRLTASFFRRHTAANVFGGLMTQVIFDFAAEPVFLAAPG